MFGKTKEIIKEVKNVEREKELELQIKQLELEHESEIKQLKLEHESEIKLLKSEIDYSVREATKKLQEENSKLKQENAVSLNKIEILEKAFENMGFDVKDMKDILNKLVDGVVAKNEIKVLKG